MAAVGEEARERGQTKKETKDWALCLIIDPAGSEMMRLNFSFIIFQNLILCMTVFWVAF